MNRLEGNMSTWAEILDRWLDADDEEPMPEIPNYLDIGDIEWYVLGEDEVDDRGEYDEE